MRRRRQRREKEVEVEEEVEVEAEMEVEKARTRGRGERRRWRREEEVEADAEAEAREVHIVKSSKIVVSIKIIIRTIKIKVLKKQLVYDQKWDIQAQTIVHDIGYYQFK